MKRIRLVLFMTAVITGTLLAVLIGPRVGFRHVTETAAATGLQAQQSAPTLASVVDRDISAVEKQIVDVAEAMPEDKFNFSPETLNIPGGDYKGVRSFAVEVKHVAASNWFIWSPLTGEKLPEGFQRAEYLLQHGIIDMVVPRNELREKLTLLASYLSPQEKEAA